MSVRSLLFGCLFMLPIPLCAQKLSIDNKTMHWEGDTRAGLNSEGWQWDLGIMYFPIRYAGVRVSAGISGEIASFSEIIFEKPDYPYHCSDDYTDYRVRFRFVPAIVLRTPRLMTWKSQDAGLYVFAEPGIILSPREHHSRNRDFCFWDIKGGINAQYDNIILTIGYEGSPFTLYPDHADSDHVTHSVYLGIGMKF